jgi:hypothetical protein
MIVVRGSLFYDHEHGLIIRQLSVWPHHSAVVSVVILFHYRQSGLIVLRSSIRPQYVSLAL